ncbi:hypothetical protein AMS68_007323 [Peltaster fructicola]|uniref:Protein kinase domain-containing protein n=1 Tax=Peltaster fructicola TaxID=286661 RepID=A0A6H0Y4B8_9PEZI|nr:hypothetical protein AMS68_007323 [Peltaster fructicola]
MDCMRDGFEQNKLLDNRFLTLSPLNHGSFGMVFIAKDTLTGQNVAIKCITKPGAQEAIGSCPVGLSTDDRSEELAIHSLLPEHDHIVNLIHDFETEYHQYMVLELCSNGDLYEAIRLGHGPLETEHVRDFMLQLVDAVQHIHANGVYHRDIKPENIFLTAARSMKLGDFGLATTETWSTEFAVGSDRYMAPEQFDASVYGYGYSPASADVWAIGIVLLNVLFQRNPFATPTQQDPLFADFAHDRQSLFDVFPTMSQDTYNVIRHSLALDPANRSLGAVREALTSVVSFTTTDESLDDFAIERIDLAPVSTAAREPLRTPSISSPMAGQDAFPWSNVLATPQKPTKRLPTIPDDEPELFPGSAQSAGWHYVDADEASLSSNLDSGLGLSYKSTKSVKPFNAKPNNFVGSLPITFSRPGKTLSPYGSTMFSKSWSDLWDEDNETGESELPAFDASELGIDISRVSTAKPSTPQLPIPQDGRGSVTPRQAKAELDRSALSSGTVTPMAELSAELPKVKSSSILDKWAALGNFRRAKQAPTVPAAAPVTPAKGKYIDAWATFSSLTGTKKQTTATFTPRERTPARSMAKAVPTRTRATSSNGKSWERREHSPKHPSVPAMPEPWTLDNNWRDHKARAAMLTNSPPHAMGTPSRNPGAHYAMTGKPTKSSPNSLLNDDIGDLEWVGGWKDFHL